MLVHKHGESRVRKSLNLLFQELNSPEFLYIEKGYIVNIRHVMSMKNHILHMRDGASGRDPACRRSKEKNSRILEMLDDDNIGAKYTWYCD